MGKVLEMTRLPSILFWFAPLAVLLSACSAMPLAKAAVPLAKAALSRVGGGTAPVVAKPAKDSDQITMTLVSAKIKFPIQSLATKGDVTLWSSGDGAQVALRNGFLISTRGFGMDLMSADVPSVADLLDANPVHSRKNTYLDGLDTSVRREYSCVVTPVTDRTGPDVTYQLLETCESDAGRITNVFWIDSANSIVRSKQWISSGVGYAIFDTANG